MKNELKAAEEKLYWLITTDRTPSLELINKVHQLREELGERWDAACGCWVDEN